MKHGIRQDSILWPILFLLFVNDLPLNIQGTKVFFSDDTKLLVTGEDECALQHEIKDVTEELQTWFHKNNLMMNTHRQKIAMPFRNEQYRNPLQLQVMFDNMYIVYK